MLELYVFPLQRVADPLQPDLPGLVAVPPTKQGVHGREGDLLILYMSLSQPQSFSSIAIKQMLQNAAEEYRKGHGTVTAGLRTIAERLNGILLEHNLRGRRQAEPVLATLNLMALRENALFLAQSGATHTFVITPETVEDYNDSLTGGRGLGFSSSLNMKYYQVQGSAGEVLVFSPNPPEAWTAEALQGSQQLTLEHLRRRLLNQTNPDLQAVVVKFQQGNGQIHLLRPRPSQVAQPAAPAPASQPSPAASAAMAPEATAPTLPADLRPETTPPQDLAVPAPEQEISPTPGRAAPPPDLGAEQGRLFGAPQTPDSSLEAPAGAGTIPSQPESPAQGLAALPPIADLSSADTSAHPLSRAERVRLAHQRQGYVPPAVDLSSLPEERPAVEPAAPRPARRRGQGRQRMAFGWLGLKAAWQKTFGALGRLLRRMAPGQEERAPAISGGSMLFIAIAIPLIVVAVATTVYFQTGRSEQRSAYFNKAYEFAASAASQEDISLKRNNWAQAQVWLDKTEELGVDAASTSLRKTIQQAMDTSEGIVRVDFKPINRYGFPSGVKITRMVANSSDIYLLDSAQGRILRLFLTGTGYESDSQFRCSPGVSGTVQVGPLVDLVLLPPNSKKATVMGIDASGTLLYCIPGDQPGAVQIQAPDSGWGKVTAIALYQETLLIMDQTNNAVESYAGTDSTFADKPHLFFDQVIPSLANVIDLAFYGDDLYLLRSDGTLTQCTASSAAFAPTRCKDPSPFGDSRPGREPNPTLLPDATFGQISATLPPDPSIYMLDTKGQGIYHFSLLLNFQRQVRPSYIGDVKIPAQAPTAFAVTPTRLIILAYANQVFYGQLP